MAPKRTTRSTPVTPAPNATTTTVTEAQLQALIDQGVAAAMAEAEASRPAASQDKFADLHSARRSLTWWNTHFKTNTPEVAMPCHGHQLEENDDEKYSPYGMFPEEVDKIEKYIGGLPDMILGSVKASKSKTMARFIEF
ncbi:hypothetical protein Tco_0734206 [Tanacetum coccineum]